MSTSEYTSAIATAADLFGKPRPRRYKLVGPLPVLGVTVRIRSLTEREVSGYQMQVLQTSGSGFRKDRLLDANRRLIALCLVDANGNTFVSDAQRAEMADWDNADTAYLYDECAKHAGINKQELEDLVKNSETTPDAASP